MLLQSHNWVAEIVYFPLDTELLRVAQQGKPHPDGVGMAVGVFRLFTGRETETGRMLKHFASLGA